MAYRNATYVAFHAGGTTNPADQRSDINYYNLMKAWDSHKSIEFSFANAHEKTAAVRDSSKRATLERRLKERLNASKNFLLIVTANTRRDTDWVPFEIRYAVDVCGLPVIATYPDYRAVLAPASLASLWPEALSTRISNQEAKAIHIPFAREPLLSSIGQFTVRESTLSDGMNYYTEAAHKKWGLLTVFESASGNYRK